jgi:hypothetical protein
MDLFLQGLPTNQRQRPLEIQINRAIKALFGRKIETALNIFRRDRAKGTLTFPYPQPALKFLAHYQSKGLPLRDRRKRYRIVKVQVSNRPPNMRLVEGLRARMEEINSDVSDPEV